MWQFNDQGSLSNSISITALWHFFIVLASNTVTLGTTLLSSLITFTIFLQTPALHTVTPCLLAFNNTTLPGFSISTTNTCTIFTTDLTRPIALAILGFTERLDTSTSKPSARRNFIKQIVYFTIPCVKVQNTKISKVDRS